MCGTSLCRRYTNHHTVHDTRARDGTRGDSWTWSCASRLSRVYGTVRSMVYGCCACTDVGDACETHRVYSCTTLTARSCTGYARVDEKRTRLMWARVHRFHELGEPSSSSSLADCSLAVPSMQAGAGFAMDAGQIHSSQIASASVATAAASPNEMPPRPLMPSSAASAGSTSSGDRRRKSFEQPLPENTFF